MNNRWVSRARRILRLRRSAVVAALIAFPFAWIGAAVALFPRIGGWHMQDISRYQSAAQQVIRGSMPYRDFSFEYPPFALAPLTLPALTVGEPAVIQRYAFSLLVWNAVWCSVIVLCVGRMARRWRTRRQAVAATAMCGLLAFIGTPLFPWRFDLFPALLSALTLLLAMEGHAATAGASLGLAIATKLYPIVLAPIVIARYIASRDRDAALRFGYGVLGTVLAIAAATVVAVPEADALSFLRYHGLRGLQIESVAAGVLMLGHVTGHGNVGIVENYGALHLVSPRAEALQHVLLPIFVIVLSGVTLAALQRFRREAAERGRPSDETLVAFTVVSLLVLLLTNKVFSPQYMIWLLPFAPLLPVRQCWLIVLATVLTIVIFPFSYDRLMTLDPTVVLLLNLRNAMLAVAAVWILRERRPSPNVPGWRSRRSPSHA